MEFDAFVSALFARAKAEGIEHAEVYYASGDSLRVRVRDQKIEDYTVSTRAGLSLRGVCGGRWLLRRPSCRTGAVPLGRRGRILSPRSRFLLFVCFFFACCAAGRRRFARRGQTAVCRKSRCSKYSFPL